MMQSAFITRSTTTEAKMQIEILKVRESYGYDFYVYVDDKLVRVCPSEDMARAVAAKYAD
jgi:hypothetical protein